MKHGEPRYQHGIPAAQALTMNHELIPFPKPAKMNGTTGSSGPRMFLRARPADTVMRVRLAGAEPMARLPESSQQAACRIAEGVARRVATMRDLPIFDPHREPEELPVATRRSGLFLVPKRTQAARTATAGPLAKLLRRLDLVTADR